MKPNVKPLSLISYICLAVILIDAASNVKFVQQVTGNNSPFLFQSSASNINNQSVLFKDHSGPSSGKIQSLDVICGKNFMSVRAEFSAPFYGIVFSKGTFGQENCVYVKPGSGLIHAAFNVYYDQCGTKPDLDGKFYENTIVIQYGSDIIEAYDEAKRLRCEWFEAYEKPASFRPAIPVADLEVVEMNFQGDDIDCWMEIQEGIEPWGRPLNKMVPVGQPMTLVVAINDNDGQFDMRVKSCFAHDGVQKPIALTDEYGCVLRPKMLTTFTKIKNPSFNRNATVLSYSRFLTFKFPDSMSVQIQCTVEVCRNGCADACQLVASKAVTNIQSEVSIGAKPWFSSSSPQPSSVGVSEEAGGPMKRTEGGSDLAPNESQQLQRPMQIPFNQPPPPPQQHQLSSSMREAIMGFENENYVSSNVNQVTIAKKAHYHGHRQQPPIIQPQIPSQHQQHQHHNHQRQQPKMPMVRQLPGARPQTMAQPEVAMGHDDMISGSDSNRQPAIAEASSQRMVPQQELAKQQQQNNRHVAVAASPPSPPAPAPTTTTTTTTSTARPAADSGEASSVSADSSPNDYNRSGGIEETPELASDENLTRLSAASEPQQQAPAPANAQGEPERNKQPAAVNVDQSQQQSPTVAQDEASSAIDSVKREDSQPQATNGGQQVGGDNQASPSEQQVSSEPPVVVVSENRPSVQGYDENMDNNKPEANEQLIVKSQQVGGAQNSLKTVELEVPANEDPIPGLLASSSVGNRGGQLPFSSVRLSNMDTNGGSSSNDAGSGFLNYEQQTKEARLGAQSGKSYNTPESVIQPRESVSSIERRDKGSSSGNGEEGSSIISSGKSRFGTRSQPIVVNVQGGSVEPPARHYNNHQASMPANDNADSVAPPVSANIDRVLTDRSDDLAGPTVDLASVASNDSVDKTASNDGDEVAASAQSSSSSAAASNSDDESPNKAEFDSMRHRTSAIMPEESSASPSSSDTAADQQVGKQQVQPVVGTDELASGPVQFEARIGASASSSDTSPEEALTKLQMQQQQQLLTPQTAALVSSQSQPEGPIGSSDFSQANASDADKLDRRIVASQEQPSAVDKTESGGPNDRLDISNLLSLVKKQQLVAPAGAAPKQQQQPVDGLAVAASSQQQQSQQMQSQPQQLQLQQQQQKIQHKQNLNQPYPNVAGQAKVIPDPGIHGSTTMAAQSATNLASILPSEQQQAVNKQMAANKQQQSDPQQPVVIKQAASTLSPVSQVPFGIGFSKSHIQPAIQKLSQQFLHSQQPQPQQQRAKQTTSKPTRGRFSLFSPHTALQAVASRFLSKTDTQQKQQQLQHEQIPAAMRQMPVTNANNVKLSSDQEQKLLLLLQQQAKQAQADRFPVTQQAQKSGSPQQQHLPSTSMIVPHQLYQPPQHWQQQQNQTGQVMGSLTVNYLQQQPKQIIRSRRSFAPPAETVAQAIDEDLVDIGMQSTTTINDSNQNNNGQAKDSTYSGAVDLPQIKIRRLVKGTIYGICFPVFSLTFMITCLFWLIVFTTIYGIYYCTNSKRQQRK